MKILLDPITTNDPQFCVMNYKMKTIVEYFIEHTDDVYFYWLIPEISCPDGADYEIDWDFFPKTDRLKLVQVPVRRDRYQEYLRISDHLQPMFDFNGPLWDFDVLVTARIMQVPFMRVWMHAIGSVTWPMRRIMTVDDMPIMSFKKTVQVCRFQDIQDRLTINGYLAANSNCFISFWEKDETAKAMKRDFSPAKVREFLGKSHDTSPIQVGKFKPKEKQVVAAACDNEKPLTVAYTQRWEVIHRKSQDIIDIMERQWILHGGSRKMRFVIASNSKAAVSTADSHEWLEGFRAPREEFWRMIREEIDVVMVMTICDDYSQSLIEPLTLGCPAIVLDATYARPTLGDDYPFFVKSDEQAYALLNRFAQDYAGMYKKFVKWQQGTFQTLMDKRNEVWLPFFVQEQIKESKFQTYKWGQESKNHPLIKDIAKLAPNELVMETWFDELRAEGVIETNLTLHKAKANRHTFNYHEWYRYRLDLIARHGFRDAGVEPGHLRRKT